MIAMNFNSHPSNPPRGGRINGFVLASLLTFFGVVPLTLNAEIGVDASFNDVSVDDAGGLKNIRTGQESRTQLSGDRGMIRVGANSRVSVREADEALDLQQGVIMVKTDRKGLLRRESLSVETEQIRATTNATMLISYQPRRYIKIACLEGKVTVSLKGLARETVTIRKGQLLIINCLENVLPDAVSVDMNRLMQTSPLLAPALHGRPARGQLGGPPRQPGQGTQPPGGNGSQPPPGNGPPPPPENQVRAQQAAQATPQARGLRPAQPRANDLAIRQIDCRISPNAPECRQPGSAAASQSMRMQQGASLSRSSRQRGSQSSNSQNRGSQPPPPRPPPPPPKPPKPPKLPGP